MIEEQSLTYLEFPEEDGNLQVEVREAAAHRRRRMSGKPDADDTIRIPKPLGNILDAVKPAAETIIGKLQELTDTPDEITVQFGIKLSSKADVIIASGTVEANYIITLKWSGKKPQGSKSDPQPSASPSSK